MHKNKMAAKNTWRLTSKSFSLIFQTKRNKISHSVLKYIGKDGKSWIEAKFSK
jgi:hypothetical protein